MTNKEFEENVLEKIVELNDALYYINRNYAAFDNAILVVSIHAPAWGATPLL